MQTLAQYAIDCILRPWRPTQYESSPDERRFAEIRKVLGIVLILAYLQELSAGPGDVRMAKAASAQEPCPELRLLMLEPFNVGRHGFRIPRSPKKLCRAASITISLPPGLIMEAILRKIPGIRGTACGESRSAIQLFSSRWLMEATESTTSK